MTKHILTIIFILFGVYCTSSGAPTVPSTYEFADLKLVIKEGARKQIQADVDALCRYPEYFQKKLAKIDLYFPIIERILKEENVPDDFKYLAVQESSLVPDAVSSSNAVGYWQFKEGSALEVGLRVDRNIDERMNIVSSTRGAAKYLKKHNFFFDNWLYALLAYNTGRGGADAYINEKDFSAKKMEITKHTHWYVKRFLAHKIAFEHEIGKNTQMTLQLGEYTKGSNKTLKELSDYFEMDLETLSEYNKWLKKGAIPNDKIYTVIIPVEPNNVFARKVLLEQEGDNYFKEKNKLKNSSQITNSYNAIKEFDFDENAKFPKIKNGNDYVQINGIPGIVSSNIDNMSSIVQKGAISKSQFMRFNDLTTEDKIIPGEVYYFKMKKSKAKIHYHVVLPGESVWGISQKYGIKIKQLLAKNRFKEEKEVKPGMVLWLRFIRPANIPIEYKEVEGKNIIVKSTPNEINYSTTSSSNTNVNTKIQDQTEETSDGKIITENPEIYSNNNDLSGDISIDEKPDESYDNTVEQSTNNEPDPQTEMVLEEDNGKYFSFEDGKEEKTLAPSVQKAQTNNNNKIEFPVKNNNKYHIVKPKETLSSISRTYEISVIDLMEWNNIKINEVLSVGQKLIVRGPEIAEAIENLPANNQEFIIYTVQASETLYSIARKHNVTIKDLMEWNNKEDFSIKENEKLKIMIK